MSSHSKDPNEKKETPPESGERQSDSELSETEDHLEHLEIAEKEKAEDKTLETKTLESPNQEGSQVKQGDIADEPVAGPSGLQNPDLGDSGSFSEAELVCVQDRNNENIQEEVAEPNGGDIVENIVADREDENQDDSFAEDSGHGSVHYIASRGDPPATRRRGYRREIDDARFPDDLPPSSSSIRSIPTDSAHSTVDTHELPDSGDTSEGISDIHNEVVCVSIGGSVYYDAREKIRSVDPPSVYVSAVESQISLSSDATSASDLPEDSVSKSSSASVSTNTGEEGHQGYLAILQKEADERGESNTSSSVETFTNQSELANLNHWRRVGEMGYKPSLNEADPIKEVTEMSDQMETSQPVSEQIKDKKILESASKQEAAIGENGASKQEAAIGENGASKQEAANGENGTSKQEAAIGENGASKTQGELAVRRKSTECCSDSSSSESASRLRPRIKRVSLKSKPVEITFNVSSDTSSESPVPKSSSSEELNRTESLESTSTSEGSPRSKKDRKPWQKPGQLRSMQHPTVRSDASIDEDDLSTPLVSPNPVLKSSVEADLKNQEYANEEKMETSPEKTETRVEKGVEAIAETESTGQESRDQAIGYKVDVAFNVDESSSEQSDFKRAARQTKRPGGRLSSSPPSDEGLGSTPPKDSAARPKKKARDDLKQTKSHRTRTESEGSLSGGGSLDVLEEENPERSPGQSDYEEDGTGRSAGPPETNGTNKSAEQPEKNGTK